MLFAVGFFFGTRFDRQWPSARGARHLFFWRNRSNNKLLYFYNKTYSNIVCVLFFRVNFPECEQLIRYRRRFSEKRFEIEIRLRHHFTRHKYLIVLTRLIKFNRYIHTTLY